MGRGHVTWYHVAYLEVEGEGPVWLVRLACNVVQHADRNIPVWMEQSYQNVRANSCGVMVARHGES